MKKIFTFETVEVVCGAAFSVVVVALAICAVKFTLLFLGVIA